MYHYLDDKEFESKMRGLCGDIMQNLCHILKEDYDIGTTFYLVGSGAKNLITQNADESVDLDYNLEILRCDDFSDCKCLKECVRKAFNEALNNEDLHDCEDSTSSLTSKTIYFTKGNKTEFKIDVCITRRENDGTYSRLIHEKYGKRRHDRYYWNIALNSNKLKEKVNYIKKSGEWQEVRERYLEKKNMYLKRNDYNHPSFICYIETINEVYAYLE